MTFHIKTLFSISLSLIILMNSFGNIPLFLSLLKGIPKKRQKQIVLRELIIALIIIITFTFIGDILLSFLNITEDIVPIAGGIVLFLLSLNMLFPKEKEKKVVGQELEKITEPFIVPLAIPLVAGPAVLAAVILYSHQFSSAEIIGSIIIAWVFTLVILLISANLSEWLKERGIIAIERIMGFIMVLISLQMLLTGLKAFMKA